MLAHQHVIDVLTQERRFGSAFGMGVVSTKSTRPYTRCRGAQTSGDHFPSQNDKKSRIVQEGSETPEMNSPQEGHANVHDDDCGRVRSRWYGREEFAALAAKQR
jgi:hypothetical protein